MADNGLINYTSRDYESLVSEFFKIVPALTELWKPEADATRISVNWSKIYMLNM